MLATPFIQLHETKLLQTILCFTLTLYVTSVHMCIYKIELQTAEPTHLHKNTGKRYLGPAHPTK